MPSCPPAQPRLPGNYRCHLTVLPCPWRRPTSSLRQRCSARSNLTLSRARTHLGMHVPLGAPRVRARVVTSLVGISLFMCLPVTTLRQLVYNQFAAITNLHRVGTRVESVSRNERENAQSCPKHGGSMDCSYGYGYGYGYSGFNGLTYLHSPAQPVSQQPASDVTLPTRLARYLPKPKSVDSAMYGACNCTRWHSSDSKIINQKL